MKTVTHKIHGKFLRPASFIDLMKDVCRPSGRYNHRVWMWRGQSDVDWRIDSSAYRRLIQSTNYQAKDKNKALISYEKRLLEQAAHRGFIYENGKKLSDFELLAKLQHHGAATRLVDFTRNCLIGLWFACNENKRKSGLLIGFDTYYLGGYERQLETRSYDDIINNLNDEIPVTWEPPGVSHRIAVQHSQFIYSAVSNKKSGSLCLPEERSYRLFEITPKLKNDCLQILTDVFDIEGLILFPDIDGFSKANAVSEDIDKMYRW